MDYRQTIRNRMPRNNDSRVRWRLSPTQIALGILVVLPLYFYCSQYIATAILKLFFKTFALSATYNLLIVWLNFINDIIIFLVAGAVLWTYVRPQLIDARRNFVEIALVGIIEGMILMYMALAIGNLFVSLFSSSTTSVNELTIRTLLKSHPLVMSLTTVVLAPIAEELVFRGVIFGSLRQFNKPLAYIVSSFVFGFVHVSNSVLAGNFGEMIQMVPYMMMGLVLAFIFDQQDNICASILTHMTNNAVATLFNILMALI